MPQTEPARRPPYGVPGCEIDPFSVDFLRNPHPAHEALREAGPVVWLEKYRAYAAARHAEVRQILGDPATFCSGRGVGLSDFQRESAKSHGDRRAWCSSATRPNMTGRGRCSIAPCLRP